MSSVYFTDNFPPRTFTVMSSFIGQYPFNTAAIAAAQAPVPQAGVSPFPLSQVRTFNSFLPTTRTNSALTLLGNAL
mgnify:CR=1 FL=1